MDESRVVSVNSSPGHTLVKPARDGIRLVEGPDAVVEVTGLRSPCKQLERLQPGLMAAVLDHDADGELVRKAGIMAVVLASGDVRPGDGIRVELPAPPHRRLEPV